MTVEKMRIDGRAITEVRPISVEVGVLPPHGSPDSSPAARHRSSQQ